MGARLVGLALAKWAPVLSDRAFRVLIRMAHTALDDDNADTPACHYFGGRDLLVSALNRERSGELESAYRTVKRAIAELIEFGAIERVNKAKAREYQAYRLTLWRTIGIGDSLVDNPEVGDSTGTPLGDSTGTPLGDTSGPKWGTPRVPPRNQEEPREERKEEPTPDHALRLTTARAREPAHNELQVPAFKCAQPGCQKGWILTGEPPTITRCQTCNAELERKAA